MTSTCSQIPQISGTNATTFYVKYSTDIPTTTHTSQAMKRNKVSTCRNKCQLFWLATKTSLITLRKPVYDNSIIVMYGDHYGTSDTRSSNLAGNFSVRTLETWSNYDKAMLQRNLHDSYSRLYWQDGILTPLVVRRCPSNPPSRSGVDH